LTAPDHPPALLEIAESGPFGFSPDSCWLVLPHGSHLRFHPTGRWNGWQQVESAAQGEESVPGPFAWSLDGRFFAKTTARGKLQLYQIPDVPGLKLVEVANLEIPGRALLRSVVFSPNVRHLAGLSRDRRILLWDLAQLDERLVDLRLGAIFPATDRR
jgi:hypothetical protein